MTPPTERAPMCADPKSRIEEFELLALDANILGDLTCYVCNVDFGGHAKFGYTDVRSPELSPMEQLADAHELWTFQVAARAMNDGWRWKSRTVYCPSCWSAR